MKKTDNSTYEQVVTKLAESIQQEGQSLGVSGLNRGPAFFADVVLKAISMSAHGGNSNTKKTATKKVAALLTLD